MATKYRVWWMRNPPSDEEYFEVPSLEEAEKQLVMLMSKDLDNEHIISSLGGLEYFDETDKRWHEWEDDKGNNIRDVIERHEREKEEKQNEEVVR